MITAPAPLPTLPTDPAVGPARNSRARGLGAAHRAEHHWTILVLSVLVLVLSLCLEVRDQSVVVAARLPGTTSGWVLPELCQFRALLGIDCPGCGLTRSFIHLAHGRWSDSLMRHRVGWVLAALIALQIPYRLMLLAGYRLVEIPRQRERQLLVVVATLLVGNWLLKLAGL